MKCKYRRRRQSVIGSNQFHNLTQNPHLSLTKSSQIRVLFALDQRGWRVDPHHSRMQQKIPHGEVSHLRLIAVKKTIDNALDSQWINVEQNVHVYLFSVCGLFVDELVENSSVLLMKLLHLVDVTRNFVHGLHCNCTGQKFIISKSKFPSFLASS